MTAEEYQAIRQEIADAEGRGDLAAATRAKARLVFVTIPKERRAPAEAQAMLQEAAAAEAKGDFATAGQIKARLVWSHLSKEEA